MREQTNDLIFMKEAFKLAYKAKSQDEVPVGAIIVCNNEIIASAYNQKESLKKATAHAEILALEEASRKLQQWRLNECTLYVTLEPCLMCAGALVAARLKRLVYSSKDPKAGAVHSLYQVTQDSRLNHRMDVSYGLLQEESSKLLQEFFREKRIRPK